MRMLVNFVSDVFHRVADNHLFCSVRYICSAFLSNAVTFYKIMLFFVPLIFTPFLNRTCIINELFYISIRVTDTQIFSRVNYIKHQARYRGRRSERFLPGHLIFSSSCSLLSQPKILRSSTKSCSSRKFFFAEKKRKNSARGGFQSNPWNVGGAKKVRKFSGAGWLQL